MVVWMNWIDRSRRMGMSGGFDELDASGNVLWMTVMIHGRKKNMAAC